MNMKSNFIAIGIIIGLIVAGGGFYSLVKKYYSGRFEADARKELENGNYLTALALYSNLGNTKSWSEADQAGAEEIKRLLIAEDSFFKAEQAAKEEKWLETLVFLKESEAVSNPSFKHYSEAKSLLELAQDRVRSSEKKTQDEIAALHQSITREKATREQAEQKRSELETNLQLTAQEKQKTATLLESTKRLAEESQKKTTEIQSQFEQEQKKVQALAEAAERERFKKFVSEFAIYVDLLNKGDEFLGNTINEIDQGRDITALTLITQGRALFNETKSKAEDLRANRTPGQYIGHVDNLIRAASYLNDAAKQLGTSLLYIQEKSGSEFSRFYNEGKNFRSQAKEFIGTIKNFIQSSQ